MPERLGEMLLKIGSLNAAKLEQVLGAQSVYGGRLGTNLVEMGFVGEEEIARVLGEKSGVPCVEAAQLDDIPGELLNAIPLSMVRRHRLLPVARNERVLTVAMADPADSYALKEVAFVTGLQVVSRVCSELRLNVALERYYGIARQTRYLPADGGGWDDHARRMDDMDDMDVAGAEVAGLRGAAKPDSGEEPRGVSALAGKLAGASGEGDVTALLLAYLGKEFDCGVLLGVTRDGVVGLGATRSGGEVEGFHGHSVPLEEAGLVRRTVEERRICLGKLAGEGTDGWLRRALGGARTTALLVPVSRGKRVAAIIGVGGVKGRLVAGAFELQRVAVMAELALEMVSLRRRIGSV